VHCKRVVRVTIPRQMGKRAAQPPLSDVAFMPVAVFLPKDTAPSPELLLEAGVFLAAEKVLGYRFDKLGSALQVVKVGG